MRSIVLAGATGFVGSVLHDHFTSLGDRVSVIGRQGPIRWDDPSAIARVIDGADALINLAGKSVNCRYTDENRDEILHSRTRTTRALRHAVARTDSAPAVWLNASTATIYRHEEDHPHTEREGILGTGFSVDVARAWEREFFSGDLPDTRRVALRMAIVLGDGPATRLLLRLARLGLAGTQYDGWAPQHRRYRGIGPMPSGDGRVPQHHSRGRQRFSWVHVDDVVGAVEFLLSRPDLHGPVNLAAPRAVENRTLMASLRRAVGIPVGLPSARWMLEPAMAVLRTEPELVLKSRWVHPGVLTEAGFAFRHTDLDEALRDVLARVRGERTRD